MMYENFRLQVSRIIYPFHNPLKLRAYRRRKFTPKICRSQPICTESNPLPVNNSTKNILNTFNEQHTVRQIDRYIEQVNPDVFEQIQTRKKISYKRPRGIWLVNKAVSQRIADILIKEVTKYSCDVIEYYPGFGLLTEHLVHSGISRLHLVENDKLFFNHLRNIYSTQDKVFLHSHTLGLVRHLEDTVSVTEWGEKPSLQILCAVSTAFFLYEIVRQFALNRGLMAFGRPIFYCFMYPSIYNNYVNPNTVALYRTSRIMIQNFFTHEIVNILERPAFIPWAAYKKNYPQNFRQLQQADTKEIYLVKLEPKPILNLNLNEICMYRTFLVALLFRISKQKLLIPTIEQYIPGAGIKLIQLNYTMTTRIMDIPELKFLEIFKILKQEPGFNDTLFAYSTIVNHFSVPDILAKPIV